MKQKIWLIKVVLSLAIAAVGPLVLIGFTSVAGGAVIEVSVASYVALALGVFVLVMVGLAVSSPILAKVEEDDREEGVVKWFNVSKGFGFVTRENGEDVFVHFRSIRGRGHRSLQEGQRVRFGVVESSKGLQAEDVSILRQK